ncbi:hypothetical protein [Nisaea sediminum]|uniref:hypothetical protein n=1 Tax=Nisaea sediminum TaxID=2775867 RepID=UPI0018668902|nr:hypothetical protein [Nisaea sediminum]
MSDVTLKFKMDEAESLQQFLNGTKIPDETRSRIARLVESGIREASMREPEVEPRYVGEHGEHNPNTLGKSGGSK